jgi:hypothetical protein
VATVVGVTEINLAYLSSEKQQNRKLGVSNQVVRASMIQLQNELQAVKGQLDELGTALRSPAHAPAARPQPVKGRANKTSRAAAQATLGSDSRFNQASEAAFGSAEAARKHIGGSGQDTRQLRKFAQLNER